MRRLYVRILAALMVTALLSFFAFVGVFLRQTGPAVGRLVRAVQTLVLDEAIGVLDREGPARAAAVLASRSGYLDAVHHLTDASGRDLLDGTDRSAMLALDPLDGRPVEVDGRAIFIQASADGRYRLVTVATPPFSFSDIVPYYVLLLGAVAVLCWVLAVDIVSPLRRIAATVETFGRGQLTARTGITRGDEIGDLARAVDGMAQRIETLVSAERRLLQDVSHELRSPLTRLNLALELSRTATDREAAAARIQRDVDRLSRLVGALLEVTRLEGEGLRARQAPVDVSALVAGVIADVEIEARARDVSIESALTPAATVGDPELLRRAVENVVRNAVRYAPQGSAVKVTVHTGTDGVALTILDAGPGVPDESLDRLGTPFFRVDAARAPASGGVGLGLAIARRAIERHGGTWQIENAHPGLRVRLSIPAVGGSMAAPS